MKVIINRCLLFVLSFVLSSTALFSVFSADVSAASDYDNSFTRIDKLVLCDYLSGTTNECSDQSPDVTLNWSAIIPSSPGKTRLLDAIQNGGNWAVTGCSDVSFDLNCMGFRVYYSLGDLNTTSFFQAWGTPSWGFAAGQPEELYLLEVAMNNGVPYLVYDTSLTGVQALSPTGVSHRGVLLSTFNNVYPPGYEGELVPDTIEPPKIQILPDVNFRVSDKRLTAEYLKNVPGATDIQWGIASTDENWENLDLIDTFEYQIDKKVNFEYKFSERGKYLLYIKVYNRPPMLPTIPDEYQQPIEIYLPLDVDGTTFGGSTDDLDCGENNFCQPYTPYEDCTIYSGSAPYGFGGGEFPDIIGGIGCVWQNFGIFLIESLKNLFIPSDEFFPAYLDRFGDWLESKLGFVKTGFDLIIDWVTSLVVVSPTCVLDNPIEGTFFGASLDSVSICVFEDEAPTIFNLMRNIFRSLFAATLVFISWGRMQGIFREWAK